MATAFLTLKRVSIDDRLFTPQDFIRSVTPSCESSCNGERRQYEAFPGGNVRCSRFIFSLSFEALLRGCLPTMQGATRAKNEHVLGWSPVTTFRENALPAFGTASKAWIAPLNRMKNRT